MSYEIIHGDVLIALKAMPDASFDAVLSDVPYGLGSREPTIEELVAYLTGSALDMGNDFMNKKWMIPPVTVWREIVRVLKPGAPVLAFAGSRTHDLITIGMRAGGLECSDTLQWHYCLSEDTEILVEGTWRSHDQIRNGDRVMCYDPATDSFGWYPIQEVVRFDHEDTAYRVRSDRTDQIVTRNHRCLVERGGAFVFELAEEAAKQREVCVPILEDLYGLLETVPLPKSRAGESKQVVQPSSRRDDDFDAATPRSDGRSAGDVAAHMFGMRQEILATSGMESSPGEFYVFPSVQRKGSSEGASRASIQRSSQLVAGCGEIVSREDVRPEQPGMERRSNDSKSARELSRGQICSVPREPSLNGSSGHVHSRASAHRIEIDRPTLDQGGDSTSHRSQSSQQRGIQPDALHVQRGSQELRGKGLSIADLARFEAIQYRGVVWCVRVQTGAFVARRNGKAFITGNSQGMPKPATTTDKYIDNHLGSERPVVGSRQLTGNAAVDTKTKGGTYGIQVGTVPAKTIDVTAPGSPEAARWEGYGHALRPSFEPITLAYKPYEGTIAQNILKYDVGALNVVGCRIGTAGGTKKVETDRYKTNGTALEGSVDGSLNGGVKEAINAGRWPANVILSHDARCSVVGEKLIRGDSRDDGRSPGRRQNGFLDVGADVGDSSPNARVYGNEIIDVYECVEDCPIRIMDEQSGPRASTLAGRADPSKRHTNPGDNDGASWFGGGNSGVYADSGGASRCFKQVAEDEESVFASRIRYQPKVSRSEREFGCESLPLRSAAECTDREEGSAGSDRPQAGAGRGSGARNHGPCLKPIELTCYLAKLLLPPPGRVRRILIPYCGTGSEMIGALRAGWDEIVGIEREAEYVEIARARLSRWGQVPLRMSVAEAVGETKTASKKVLKGQGSLF